MSDFFRPIMTITVFVGVVWISCWIASFFMTVPGGTGESLMGLGVLGLIVAVIAFGPILIPILILAVILARETWRRIGALDNENS